MQRSKGVHLGSSAAPASAEDIAFSMRSIGDFSADATYPTSPTDAIKSMMGTSTSLGSNLSGPYSWTTVDGYVCLNAQVTQVCLKLLQRSHLSLLPRSSKRPHIKIHNYRMSLKATGYFTLSRSSSPPTRQGTCSHSNYAREARRHIHS